MSTGRFTAGIILGCALGLTTSLLTLAGCRIVNSYLHERGYGTNHQRGNATLPAVMPIGMYGLGPHMEKLPYPVVATSKSGKNTRQLNKGKPGFTESEITRGRNERFIEFGSFDYLGRTTGAIACVDRSTVSNGKKTRTKCKPTGWAETQYKQKLVPGCRLYTRTHLIAQSIYRECSSDPPEFCSLANRFLY